MSQFKKCSLHILLLGLFALSTTLNVTLRAQDAQPGTPTKALSGSVRRVVFDNAAFSGTSTPLPHWDNGYLISLNIETFQSGTSNVRLYDPSGKQARAASIWFPEAVRVLIYSATATSDGRIIAAGAAEKQDGTGASFIAMTDLLGKPTNIIQTKGFAPLNVCQAPDGTVWSFGGTGFNEQKHSEPNPGDMLRHFDFQKGEIASYLARSGFPNLPRPEAQARIHCSADEVVAYSSNAHAYIELKYGSGAPQVYHVEEPSGLQFNGFATTGSKKVYGYFSKLAKSGLYYLSFEETSKTARWLPVTGTLGVRTTPGVIIGLWGADGDKLLISRAEDPTGESAFHWASPVDR
jgi:hypothetical protein